MSDGGTCGGAMPGGAASGNGLLRPTSSLTHRAALRLVGEAAEAAERMGVPMVIAVVDAGCNLLALLRMDGSRLISLPIVQAKAATAASTGRPTGFLPTGSEVRLGLASGGRFTNLQGGLPIVVDGQLVGGIGVGSGTGEQDVVVAQAALDRLLRTNAP